MPDFANQAQIDIVTSIPPDDQNAKFILPSKEGVYVDYKVRNHYDGDLHRYMMGITSPEGFQGKSVAFCQLTAPTLLWVSRWTACRFGYPPDIPDPESKDSNLILLDRNVETGTLTLTPDGITVPYRISGTYVYGCVNPNNTDPFKDITFGVPPFLDATVGVLRQMPDGSIRQGIINMANVGHDIGPLFAKPQGP